MNTPINDSELKKYPKVELHRHLELSMRHSTMREIAKTIGLEVPASLDGFEKMFLITEPMNDLGTVLKKFLDTQKLLHSEEVLTRLTFEAIEDAVQEGIRILELRFAPTFIQQGHDHLSFEKAHAAIVKGVQMARHLPISVGLILTCQRILSVALAERVAHLGAENKDTICGLDLADNELEFSCLPFARAFEIARKAGLKITVHAGEAPGEQSEKSMLDAIQHLGAQRIGHGVQVAKYPETMKLIKQKMITLELCPTSNVLTNAVKSIAEHPFRYLMEQGLPVTLNSDDPSVFNIDLVHEYQVMTKIQKLTASELDRINDTAAAASFISLKEKQKNWPRPIQQALAPWN